MIKIEQRNNKILFMIIIALYITVFALNWNRLHCGVEISDEAFYVSEAYIVSQGAIPFTNNWAQITSSTLLYSPLVKLYTAISGGTEGTYLFMRQAFLIYKILIAGILVLLFKRSFPFLLSLLLPLPYLALAPHGMGNFSYNTLSLSLLLISSVLVFTALNDGEKYSKQFSFLGGVVMAFTILAHLMQLFTASFVLILFFIFERKRYKTLFRSCLFTIGGFITAVIVLIYLAAISGGIKPVFDGIANILQSSYFYIEKIGLSYNLEILKETIRLFINFLIIVSVIFTGLSLLYYFLQKRIKIDAKTLFVLALFFAELLYVLFYVYRYRHSEYYNLPLNVSICYAYVLILLLFAVEWKKHIPIILLVFSPFLVNYLLNVINWSGLGGRGYILFPSVMLCVLLNYFALEKTTVPFLTYVQKTATVYASAIILTAAFCASYTLGYYGYVYRDGPVPTLTYKIEGGVFKGLRTTEERGKALIHLEDEIQKVTDKEDLVMFRDQAPHAYLMTKAGHCTPSTWDILLYTYAYNDEFIEGYDSMDDSILHEYFRTVGKEPTKIIYVQDKERLVHLSLWDENYRFNQYIERYYTQTYTNNEEQFAIIVFERKSL